MKEQHRICATCIYDLREDGEKPCKYCYNSTNKPYWEGDKCLTQNNAKQ